METNNDLPLNSNLFPAFRFELRNHDAPRYHELWGPLAHNELVAISERIKCKFNSHYAAFLETIGPGYFFAGKLVLFGHPKEPSLVSAFEALASAQYPLIAIGNDGTSDGMFVMAKNGSPEVHWYTSGDELELVDPDFLHWIESVPTELFDSKLYEDFASRNQKGLVLRIVAQRRNFKVELLNFSRALQRPPDKPNDFLPRYNRAVFSITKYNVSALRHLTVCIERTGSEIGPKNVTYHTIEVSRVGIGSKLIEEYVFDPFNLPFDQMLCVFDPEIPDIPESRIRYKELKEVIK